MKIENTPIDIHLRAHVVPLRCAEKESGSGGGKRKKRHGPPKWPKNMLVLGMQYGGDISQALTLGAYRWLRGGELIEEGFFYTDIPLRDYAKKHTYNVQDFLKKVFWPAVRAGAIVAGFDLAKILTRLFCGHTWRSDGRGNFWFGHTKKYRASNGEWIPSFTYPYIRIAPQDGRYPNISSGESKDKGKYPTGRFLCLAKLAYAQTGEHFSLPGACEHFGLPVPPGGGPGATEAAAVRGAVRSASELLAKLRAQFDRHPIDLLPERAASSATFAKKYLEAFGIERPSEKFKFSPEVLGAAWESYHGGDSSTGIRGVPVPVVPLDFLSQYALVNVLLGLSRFLTAQSIEVVDATEEARAMFSRNIGPGDVTQDFCKQLNGLALVDPQGFPFPVSADYDGEDTTMGINYLHSREPIWFAWPDLVAAILRSNKPFDPKRIIKAIKFVPVGTQDGAVPQDGLRPVKFCGSVEIDPRRDDIFKKIVEERMRAKDAGNTALADSLKVVLASMAYGVSAEVNVERLKPGDKTEVLVYSGERKFRSPTTAIERPGPWSFPPVASLVCAGSRMLLALVERMFSDLGGVVLMRDTDALSPVATEKGGLIPCALTAVKALSWAEVERVRGQINLQLNPSDRDVVCEILKVEKVNTGPDGKQREVIGEAYSAKHYSLSSGGSVVKASAHALGNFLPPIPGWDEEADCYNWIKEAHAYIRGGPGAPEPAWLDFMVTREYKITHGPHLAGFGEGLGQSVRPWTSLLVASLTESAKQENPDLVLVAPFSDDASRWHALPWTSKSGKRFKVHRSHEEGTLGSIEVLTYRDMIEKYVAHPEMKSLGPDGRVCGPDTKGPLSPRTVIVSNRIAAGKAIDRREEIPGAAELVDGTTRTIYAPRVEPRRKAGPRPPRAESPELAAVRYELLWHKRGRVAEVAGVSRRAVQNFLLKKRHANASTIKKLKSAAIVLGREHQEQRERGAPRERVEVAA